MKKITTYLLSFCFIAYVLFSCESLTPKTKIEIKYDNQTQKGWLIIDKKDSVKLIGDTTFAYEIALGQHTFQVNKQKPFIATIEKDGGILNLSKTKFVRFFQEYQSTSGKNSILNKDEFKHNLGLMYNLFIIDSTIYIYKDDSTINYTNDEIRIALKKMNYRPISKFKVYEQHNYIAKDWDYGLTEEFPDEIQIETKTYGLFNNATKTKVIEYDLFIFLTYYASDNFVIRDYNEVMRDTINKQDGKTKKQIAF